MFWFRVRIEMMLNLILVKYLGTDTRVIALAVVRNAYLKSAPIQRHDVNNNGNDRESGEKGAKH